MRCLEEWIAPFWGGEPDALERHVCDEFEDHEGDHRCQCGERLSQGDGA